MSHSIIRVQKMKSIAIKGIQFHNQREKESQTNPDIRTEDAHLNYDLINGNKKLDYKKEIQQVISENVKTEKKIRKDAVLLSEFLITSDSSFFDNLNPDEQKHYFETAKDFIADKYGEQNIIYATVHNDEKTPHMHVGLVPVTDDGRLSAKDVFGNRLQFVKLQDSFNDHVKAHGFDLERGVSSNRKHLDMAKFKAKTAYEVEKEATQKYEQTISNIQTIDKKIKAVEDVQATKKFGHVLMKNEDYDTLVNYATTGAVSEIEATDLSRQLTDSKAELVQVQKDAVKGQEKLRKSYHEIELESEKLQKNFEKMTDEKAIEKFKEVFNEQEIVKKYNSLTTNHIELETNFKQVKKENLELNSYKKSSLREEAILNSMLSDNEKEIKSLRNEVKELTNELSAWKERAIMAFHHQFKRIKTFLNVRDVEPEKLKALDAAEDRIVAASIKEIDKPKEKQKTMEMER